MFYTNFKINKLKIIENIKINKKDYRVQDIHAENVIGFATHIL